MMNDAVRLATPQIGMWEGRVPWLYLDTRGNVTVAMGRMLPNLMSAFALPFSCQAPGETASKSEIEADWNRVISMPFGPEYSANFYQSPSSVFLEAGPIDRLACEDLTRCDDELRRDFPTYDELPLLAKVGMLDMDYNLGETKLRNTYPKFDCAVDRMDFLKMAAECSREGISAGRNDWTRKQFAKCLAGRTMAAPSLVTP